MHRGQAASHSYVLSPGSLTLCLYISCKEAVARERYACALPRDIWLATVEKNDAA